MIIKNTVNTWRMADVTQVIGSAKSRKVPVFFQVTYVDNNVTNWFKADQVTRIVSRV